MNKKIIMNYSLKDILVAIGPLGFILIFAIFFAIKHIEPAPPNHLVISTGNDESDLSFYAKQYQDTLKQEGVTLEIRTSQGPFENLKRLEEDSSGVSAAFVQDGLGSTEAQPDVVSLGSLYYEPMWVFYRSKYTYTHFSQLEGDKIAVGLSGHGTQILAQRLLKMCGVDLAKTKMINIDSAASAQALKKGEVDAAFLMLPPEDPIIKDLILHKEIRMMNVAQAEAISRKDAAFHHLTLPRGSLNLEEDIPDQEINLIASTGTLLIRDDLHPALAFLLLKAASEVHSNPGIFEKRGEFPTNKDDIFPLSSDAIQFYKSGGSLWQRYLPYWLAAWFDRFILLVIPLLAIALPTIRLVPKVYNWRIRSRIYQRYGELKFLETQIQPSLTKDEFEKFQKQLVEIEDRVNKMKIPQNFSDYIYSLKGHIQFVHDRLEKTARKVNT